MATMGFAYESAADDPARLADRIELEAWLAIDAAAADPGARRAALVAGMLDTHAEMVRDRGVVDVDVLADLSRDISRLSLDADTPGAEHEPSMPHAVAYTVDELKSAVFPDRPPLIYRGPHPLFRKGTLAQLYAYRGLGKTWVADTVAIVAAAGVDAMGLRAPKPFSVLLVDGEMPGTLKAERLLHLMRLLHVESCPRLVVVAADWQPDFLPRVDTAEGQTSLEPLVAPADLVIFDNRSCLLDSEGEKDATAWQPMQEYLLALRRRGKAVLLVHHANRAGGARGLGKAEDVMDVVLKLSRPDDYHQEQGARFKVEFDKARGLYGDAATPFIAALTEGGWRVGSTEAAEQSAVERKIRDYLATAAELGESPRSASAVVRHAGVKKQTGLETLSGMVKAGVVVKGGSGGYVLA